MAEDTILQDWVAGTTNYRIRASIVTGVSVVYTIFVIVTLTMFIIVARNKRSGLEKRSVKLVFIQALGCYLAGVDGLVTAALNNWACFVRLWLFNVGFMLSLSAMFARAFHLMVVYKVHELTSKLSARDPMQIINEMDAGVTQSAHMLPKIVVHSSLIGHLGVESMEKQNGGSLRSKFSRTKLTSTEEQIRDMQQLKKYRRLLPYATDRMLITFILISLALTMVLSLVINITNKQFAVRPVQSVCNFFWGFLPVTAIIIVYFFIVFPLILWRVWGNRDAYGIRHDLIICDTVGIAVLIVTLVWVNVLHETQQIWPGLSYVWIYAFFLHISSVFVPLLNAIKHNKSALEGNDQLRRPSIGDASMAPRVVLPLSNRRANFNRMLDDPIEYSKFRTFAVSCFSSELTAFIEEYQVLKTETIAVLRPNSMRGRPSASTMCTIANPEPTKLSAIVSPHANSNSKADSNAYAPTSVTTSILNTLTTNNPNTKPTHTVSFPSQLFDKLKAIYWDYIDPNSYTSVNASPMVVRRIAEQMNTKDYNVTLFDELKDEVLFMLYSDVYTRYIRK
ncbi:hypothetical protein GGH12_002566 [Coemansia sp. RSA 1822]|nr:hypothetical protein GGH12_002566 [Coemansia sp. RSA 1822]